MAFLDETTQILRPIDRPVSVIIKDTVTVEDIVFMYARTAAVSKLGTFNTKPNISANVRKQVTRVPYVR
jgi:hypothetical protein